MLLNAVLIFRTLLSNMAWYVNKKTPYKKLRMILVNLGQNNAHDFEDLEKKNWKVTFCLECRRPHAITLLCH